MKTLVLEDNQVNEILAGLLREEEDLKHYKEDEPKHYALVVKTIEDIKKQL